MNDILDLSSPEYSKDRIKEFLFSLLQEEKIKKIDASKLMKQLEIFCVWLIKVEFALQKLKQQSPKQLEEIKKIYVSDQKLHWPNVLSSPASTFLALNQNEPIALFELFHHLPLLGFICTPRNWDILASLSKTLNVAIPSEDFTDIYPFFEQIPTKKFKVGNCYCILDSKRKYKAVFTRLTCDSHSFLLPRLSYESFQKNTSPLPVYHEEMITQNPKSIFFLFNNLHNACQFQNILRKVIHKKKLARATEAIEKIVTDFQQENKAFLAPDNRAEFDLSYGLDPAQAAKYDAISKITKPYSDFKEGLKRLPDYYLPLTSEVIFSTYQPEWQLQETDYSALKNHPVTLCTSALPDEKTWLIETLHHLTVFYQKEIDPQWVVRFEAHLDFGNLNSCGVYVFSSLELVLQAVEQNLDFSSIHPRLAQAALQIKNKNNEKQFLIDDILDRRSILMITAASGVGKSLFAMNLGYALATQGKLINNWIVTQKCKVLYICDVELDKRTLAKHKEKFKKLYHLLTSPTDFIIEHADRWNLNEENDQKNVEKIIEDCVTRGTVGQPVSVIIFDSLNRLAPGAHQEKVWEKLSLWLTSLCQKDLSIILVHHSEKEDKNGYLGTSKIQNDVDVHIHLAADDGKNVRGNVALKLQMKKNRRSWLERCQKKFTLVWTDKNPHWIEDDGEQLQWKKRPDTRVEEISQLRNNGKTAKEIADRYAVSVRTVENFIFKHPEIPKLNQRHSKSKHRN